MWVKKLSGLLSDEKIFFPPLRTKPSVLSCVDRSLVTILTEQYWLLSCVDRSLVTILAELYWLLSCVDRSLVTILAELYWLLNMHKTEILIQYKSVQVSTPKIPNGFGENFT